MENQKLSRVFTALVEKVSDVIREEGVTHTEYRQAVAYLEEVAKAGELSFIFDLFLETVADEATHAGLPGTASTLQGPFFTDDAPVLEKPYVMPMREGEPGEIFYIKGSLYSTEGRPIPNAVFDIWHSDNEGRYSEFYPDVEHNNLRARITTDEEGKFEVRSILPIPYEVPKNGPTGRLLKMLGMHAFRPAHVHFKFDIEGYDSLITQIYFEGDEWLESDVANAVRPSLVKPLQKHDDPVDYEGKGFDRPYYSLNYDFVLRSKKKLNV